MSTGASRSIGRRADWWSIGVVAECADRLDRPPSSGTMYTMSISMPVGQVDSNGVQRSDEQNDEQPSDDPHIVGRTLVLNVTYQPLTVVSDRRAVLLLLDRRAELVESTGRLLRSQFLTLEVPSVIRMCRPVKARWRPYVPLSRRSILNRDERRCGYCGSDAQTVDHILPRSRGGTHTWNNLVAACRGCNTKKANRTPEESSMRLRVVPREPSGSTAFAVIAAPLEPQWCRWVG